MRYAGLIFVLSAIFVGCGTTGQSAHQLERVAKDWCLSVRASQIIPVYPLTEDLQPGDVFLVQTPIEDQIKVYESKGFLPLENLLVRLHPQSFYSFYAPNGYGINSISTIPPRLWQFPTTGPTDFSQAPLAAFPTYEFAVSRSGGLNVALPVQGVPVGLNLLDSAAAHGLITIANSYTYGTDIAPLETLVKQWAAGDPPIVSQFTPVTDKTGKTTRFYLRVVNRVYLTNRVNISLFSDEAAAGGVTAGVPKPVDLLNIAVQGNRATQNFDLINQILSKNLSGAAASSQPSATQPGLEAAAPGASSEQPLAGGTLKVAMASSRSISMVETFPRPLVIGYIAFDLPILEDGSLGAPVATAAQLAGRQPYEGHSTKYGPDDNTDRIRRWLRSDQNRQELGNWLAGRTPRYDPRDIPAILSGGEFGPLRAEIVQHFNIP